MREYNCDALKGLEVPEALIEKALTAPAAVGATKAVVRPLRRMIAAAAVFFIGILSVSLYFIIRNIHADPLIVAPAVQPSVPATVSPTDASEIPAVLPTEPTEMSTAVPTAPAEVPTTLPEPSSPVPTQVPQPVVTAPAVTSIAPPTEPPTTPAVNPTEEPTDPPEPSAPTEPVVPQKDEIASVGYMVPISSYTGSEDLYCRLYSSSGRLIGGEELYDESHRVYFTTGSGYLFLSYPLGALVEPLPPDNYTIIFYDADGNDFYICSAFLSKR